MRSSKCREQEGLRAAARFAGTADPRRVHVGQRGEPVKCADAVPGLEGRQAQAPAPQAIVQEHMSKWLAVVVADHVVHENNAAELGPANTPLLDLGIHSPVIPVSVRTQNRGHAAALIRRPVEVAAEREPGKSLEDDLFDRVIVAIELSADLGIERGLGKHRPEPERDQHLLAEMNGPVVPGSSGLGCLKIRTLPVGADMGSAGVACRLDRLDASSNQIKHRFLALVRARRKQQQRRHGRRGFRLSLRGFATWLSWLLVPLSSRHPTVTTTLSGSPLREIHFAQRLPTGLGVA